MKHGLGRLVVRLAVALAGAALATYGLMQMSAQRDGLVLRENVVDGMPVRFVVADDRADGSAPGVLVAHGFAASQRVMLGYAYALAHDGYAVVLWDFVGHGANTNRPGEGGQRLHGDVDAALAYLLGQPEVDRDRLAIVGHSMGSGAAMTAGIRYPGIYRAVVAISPTGAAVTEDLPRNLLLQAGGWETRFVANARRLLASAGGERSGPNARSVIVVPNVEHLSILYSRISHAETLAWLNHALSHETQTSGTQAAYVDRRPVWYGIQLLGVVAVFLAAGPLFRRLFAEGFARGRHGLPAVRAAGFRLRAIAVPLAATAVIAGITAAVGLAGGSLAGLGGLSVGGTLALWFALYGTAWLLLGFRPAGPSRGSVVAAIALFGVLWAFVGLAGQEVLLQWNLTAYRLVRYPVAALMVLPWLLAAGYAQAGGSFSERLGVYLLQTIPILVALAVLGLFVPGLFFVVLILPVLPVAILLMATLGAAVNDPWAYAIGNALFFGWMLVAVFPIA